jgi:UPF0755 protein
MPADPYSRPGDGEQHIPPPAGPPDSGPLPSVPRQGSYPGQHGAPGARYLVQGGWHPADPPGQPGDPYLASDDPAPAPGDRYAGPGDRYLGGRGAGRGYPGPADDYGAPVGYGDGHDFRGRDGYEDRDDLRGRDGYGDRDDFRGRDGYGDRDDLRGRDEPGPGGGRGDRGDPVFWGEPANRGDPGDGEHDGWGFGRDDDDRPARPRRRRGRWAGLIALLGILAIVVPLAVGGFYAYRVISAHFFPADYSGDGTGRVIVQIRPGDSATTVGDRLFALGVVASTRAFVNAAEHSSKSSALEPGFYRLHRHMNATLAFNLLLKPSSRVQLKVTIPEGWRVRQIVAALGHNSGIPPSDYKQALRHTAALGLPSYAHGNPEGFLFPATYDIQPGMTATGVLQAMVKAFDQEAASVNLAKAAGREHLTSREAIVVASLAQAEGGKVSDFAKITRVIYNRLAAGMPLQLDSTVLYALHSYGILATSQQLKVRSRYNTYKHTGLPPGPIDSPGDAAIRAALHPASGHWLYFVTVNPKTRKTVFTSSQAEFNRLRAELQRNLGQGG